MSKLISAGLLLYSNIDELRVLLAHPGGPYFAKKDEGAWTIPKGLTESGEDLLPAAKREFAEETGYQLAADTDFLPLGSVQLKGGKLEYLIVDGQQGPLNGWRIRGGVDFDFPDFATTGDWVLSFDPTDPANFSKTAAFRAHYDIPADVNLIGGYSGSHGNKLTQKHGRIQYFL